MKEEKKGGRQGKPASEYWQERAIEREALWNKKCRATIEAELAEQYTKALTAIQEDITALYGMFAKDNKLELHEAIALLKGEEYKQWRMSLEAYAKLSETDNAILRELNTLAMRSRVSRLEKLHSETLQELYKLGVATEERMNRFLEGAFKDNYYRSLFEIGRTAGLYSTISAVDDKLLEKVLKNPWSGKAYSARIWTNQEKLAQTLKDTVFAGIHRGVSVPKLSRLVKERMDVGRYEATRLVRTELNYVHNQANLESIKDSGMMFYKFVATLDSRTSQKCRAHDGSIVPVEEASPGDNLPPLHPHCRSTIIGSLGEGKGGQKGTRIARDSEGHSFHVPRQMKYSDYKAVYIDQSKTIDQWAAETGFTEAVAKYTPKSSSHEDRDNGIIDLKKQIDSETQTAIPDVEYKLAVRRQVQNRHIAGTPEHSRYVEKLEELGMEPSVFYDDIDIKSLIEVYHKKGIYDPAHDGSTREYVNVGRYIGKYWDLDAGRLIDTTFIKIIYSKKGVHAYPIRPK